MPPPGSPLPTFSYCLLLPRVERFGFEIRVLSTEGERGTFLCVCGGGGDMVRILSHVPSAPHPGISEQECKQA